MQWVNMPKLHLVVVFAVTIAHTFAEIDNEIISTVILLFPLIQVLVNNLVKLAEDKSAVR